MGIQNKSEEEESWIRRVRSIFLEIDNQGRSPSELDTAFQIMIKAMRAHQAKFSELFFPGKEYFGVLEEVEKQIIAFNEAMEKSRKRLKAEEGRRHKLILEHARLTNEVIDLESQAYTACLAYFRLVKRDPPKPPNERKHYVIKKRIPDNKPAATPVIEMPKREAYLDEVRRYLKRLDDPNNTAARKALDDLIAYLATQNKKLSAVFMVRSKEFADIDALERHLIKRITEANRCGIDLNEISERTTGIREELKVLQTEIFYLTGLRDGAKNEIELWTSKLQREKDKRAGKTAHANGTPHQSNQGGRGQTNVPPQQPTQTYRPTQRQKPGPIFTGTGPQSTGPTVFQTPPTQVQPPPQQPQSPHPQSPQPPQQPPSPPQTTPSSAAGTSSSQRMGFWQAAALATALVTVVGATLWVQFPKSSREITGRYPAFSMPEKQPALPAKLPLPAMPKEEAKPYAVREQKVYICNECVLSVNDEGKRYLINAKTPLKGMVGYFSESAGTVTFEDLCVSKMANGQKGAEIIVDIGKKKDVHLVAPCEYLSLEQRSCTPTRRTKGPVATPK